VVHAREGKTLRVVAIAPGFAGGSIDLVQLGVSKSDEVAVENTPPVVGRVVFNMYDRRTPPVTGA
jgi:hypothetical protein